MTFFRLSADESFDTFGAGSDPLAYQEFLAEMLDYNAGNDSAIGWGWGYGMVPGPANRISMLERTPNYSATVILYSIVQHQITDRITTVMYS
jgi:hypothetical protein